MVENLNTLYENEIHRVDSPFNKDFKHIYICQGCPNFGEGTTKSRLNFVALTSLKLPGMDIIQILITDLLSYVMVWKYLMYPSIPAVNIPQADPKKIF